MKRRPLLSSKRSLVAIAALLVLASGCRAGSTTNVHTTNTDSTRQVELTEDDSDVTTEDDPDSPDLVQERVDRCQARFTSQDLSGNRGGAIARNTLQVVMFYDGEPHRQVEVRLGLSDGGWIAIGGDAQGGPIAEFNTRIETRQYDITDCALTGEYEVQGVTPNGVVDGIAIGVLWRDTAGRFTMWKSSRPHAVDRADYVGLWPLGFGNPTFADRTAQITDSFGREAAIAIIVGAQLVGDGDHHF